MKRTSIAAMFAGACAVAMGAGQSAAQAPPTAAGKASPKLTSIVIYPLAPADPALQYQLLPPEQDIAPGNAATRYLTALTLLPKYTPEQSDEIDKLLHVPLAEFDEKVAQSELGNVKSALHILSTGARTERANWESNIRREGVRALLPSLGPVRNLSNLLTVSIRLHIKEHQWDEARDELQSGFALARHMDQGDTLIESLVGISIAGRMEGCLEDWIAEPNAPNLFWPLANLPCPFNDMQHPLAMERSWIHYQIPVLKEFAEGRYSVDGWFRLVKDSSVITNVLGNGPTGASVPALGLLTAVADYPQAKEALIARGASAEEVEKRSVAAVLEEFFLMRFTEISDDTFKWNGIAADQAFAAWRAGKIGEKYFGGGQPKSFADVICRVMIPSLGNARFSVARLDRHGKMLQIVEALRAAAAEKGSFPDTLDGLALPLPPLDPVTGQPFIYTPDGASVTLSSPGPKDSRNDEWHVSIHR